MAGRNRRWLIALLLGVALPRAAQAQDNPPLWRWVNSGGSFCIWYLADPTIARTLLPDSLQARPVSASSALPPTLLRIVQDEPRFAEWIPGIVCIGQYEVVAANGTPVGHEEKGHPVRFTLTALSSDEPEGWRLLELGLDAGRLDQVAEDLGIRTRERQLRVRRGLKGEDDQWSLRLDGAELGWIGHPLGESGVGMTRSMSFGYTGEHDRAWRLDLVITSETTESQVGSLRIEGKGPLAQALKSSPIRAVGALEQGGEAVMTFLTPTSRAP